MNEKKVIISATPNRKKYLLGLGVILFILGFVELSLVTWILLNMQSGEIGATPVYSIAGLILESAGIISILLSKLKK